MNTTVDSLLQKAKRWHDVMAQLRMIAHDCGLTETVKWGKPCYTFQESNIVIIQPFKKNCALMFFKGVLLEDPEDILEKPGPNSKTSRRISFRNVQEIAEIEPVLKAYIEEAKQAEKAGLEVKSKKKPEPKPEELQAKLDEDPTLNKAFNNLTPGRQRGYILYFSKAKQSKTRTRRVEKYIPKILEGKGFHD